MKPLSSERGVALVVALLISMLMSAMIAGFLATVNADQASSGIERDQTQAYAAAHAGVEKLTADLGQLFAGNFSPTGAQVDAIAATARRPNLQGISYARPDGTSGYRIDYNRHPTTGNPVVANTGGTQIAAGPYAGLIGLITPYRIEVTARTAGDAEVKMRREFQTVAIPVFQFGLFSENNLSFFAGPNFSFGGKVHTNQNLFLKQDNGNTLTLQDRVTAVGEVVRQRLANGQTTHTGTVRVARAPGCPAAPTAINANCFNLALNQGSVTDSVPPASAATPNPNWADISMGTSNGWIRTGRTGARRLDLPIVSDGAQPVDLIRRPPVGEVNTSAIARQRFFNMASLRILLSDTSADITNLPGVVGAPVRLGTSFTPPAAVTGSAIPAVGTVQMFAASPASTTANRDLGFRTSLTPSLDGYILINRQDRNGTWTNVTTEVLSLGFTGKRLSTGVIDMVNLNNNCGDPHPNAIIRLQRVADTVANANGCIAAYGAGQLANLAALNGSAQNYWPNVLYDPREGMLRDDENARPLAPAANLPPNVFASQPRLYWGGVMHYVELDVRNLRRWMRGEIGSNGAGCINGAGGGACAMDITGFVVYFSDRRGNRDLGANNAPELNYDPVVTGFTYADDRETGEFGFEDTINPGSATSVANNQLDGQFTDALNQVRFAEDVNARDDMPKGCNLPDSTTPCTDVYNPSLETYGRWPRVTSAAFTVPPVAGSGMVSSIVAAPNNRTPANNVYDLYTTPIDRNVARVNRAFFFRRALKIVNAGRGDLPANGSQGLTVASENPVYIQGNFNACVTSTTLPTLANNFNPACTGGVGFGNAPGNDHVSAAVIADSVTFLSNAWNDIRSFVNPHRVDPGSTAFDHVDANGKIDTRQASPTWYRVALIAGKGLNFIRPTNNGADHSDFGTDGGAHNFIRYDENWGGVALNYRGSLISFYTSRQAIGTYKCCDIVYGAPSRGYNFDTDFLTPTLLPPRTPMFRDVNTLTFRQILRPTQ